LLRGISSHLSATLPMIYSVKKNDRKHCSKENTELLWHFFRNIPVALRTFSQDVKLTKKLSLQ
jgi:hypothetical protein